MTTHMPECWSTDPSDPPAWCICDELRACEERVIARAVQRVKALPWSHENWMAFDERVSIIAAIKGDQP
jgi:hypothetical protein